MGHARTQRHRVYDLKFLVVKSGLRKHLPRRVGRGDVANSLEALLAYSWMEKKISLDEIVSCLKEFSLIPSQNFANLAELVLQRIA